MSTKVRPSKSKAQAKITPPRTAAKKTASAARTAKPSASARVIPAKSRVVRAKPHPKEGGVEASGSKQSRLIALLTDSGATLAEITALTGWQAHSIRGVISGVLRKKLGLNVMCEKSAAAGESRYHIRPAANA